ncbi:MAG: SUMF1/EgtB/PvdO family nonheme iron enzyme [Rhodocyclales bacterium]|nr:SUMF1/EgtB/PvdO family nonheme iron enzyme [Rhodocyclales bacterium]
MRVTIAWVVSLLALACAALPSTAWAAADGTRVALIIGNSAYPTAPLKNPANDAADLAYAMEKKGFSVLLRENVSERGLKEAVEEFAKFLKKGGVGFFFFAGHGVQVKDQNFLVPVDASFQSEADIAFKSVSAEYVLARMAEAGNRVNVVVLDACRNNPCLSAQGSGNKGLAAMRVGQAEKGTFISYATSPGSTAADGEGRNGLYTKHLLRSLELRDSDIDKVFGRVRSGVVQDTGGQQVPWTTSSIIGNFYFDRGEEQEAAARPVAPTTLVSTEQERASISNVELPPYDPIEEKAFWQRIHGSSNAADYQNYLKNFPGGPNAAFARFRLKRLGAPIPAITTAATDATRSDGAAQPARPTQLAALAPPSAAAPVRPPPSAGFAAGASVRDCPDCPELVTVPAGEYMMGSDPNEPGREPDEGPVHRVRISGALAVGKFEVSRGEFSAFAKETNFSQKPGCNSTRGGRFARLKSATWQAPGFGQSAKDPVVCVSWEEAQSYIRWLSKKTGKAYRLLSEAEWEYVARAGGPSGSYWGAENAGACRHANVADQSAQADVPGPGFACRDGFTQTAPAGSFNANGFGVFDMLGNAWEWVADCWNKNYDGAPDNGAARNTGTCDERVFRGGAWNSKPILVRTGYRDREELGERHDNLGFRIVRSAD